MADTFTIKRNLTNALTISISNQFTQQNTAARMVVNPVALVATPTMAAGVSAAMVSNKPTLSATSSAVTTGTTTKTYSTTTADCGIVQGRADSFSTLGLGLWIGSETTGGVVTGNYKNWMPFVASDLTQGGTIKSATLKIYAAESSSSDVSIKIYGDNRANAVAPTNYNELSAVSPTAAVTSVDALPSWVAGTLYTFDITGQVQEIIKLASWGGGSAGKTVGIWITRGSLPTTGYRYAASWDNVTYTEPQITVTY
jgi:hypothetical protein